MSSRMQINSELTVGPQPSESELRRLSDDGFHSVVNFRTEGEDEQPISPGQEGQIVQENGLEYVHVPVAMDAMDASRVDQFRERLASLPKPVLLHCKSGKRAGAMTMMHVAVENGMSGQDALDQAEKMGFECDVPELKEFVKSYVDQHSQAKA